MCCSIRVLVLVVRNLDCCMFYVVLGGLMLNCVDFGFDCGGVFSCCFVWVFPEVCVCALNAGYLLRGGCVLIY